jgi:putative tricarboxylic transport membrane protein
MKVNDALSGALLALLALAVLFAVRDYPSIPGQDIGPAAFPTLLAGLLLACSAVLVWRGLRDRAAAWVAPGAWLRSPRHLLNVALVVGGLALYVAVSDRVGFIPLSLLILSALFLALRVRPVLILPVALAATLVIHTVFYKLLRVPLPWGWLQGIAW